MLKTVRVDTSVACPAAPDSWFRYRESIRVILCSYNIKLCSIHTPESSGAVGWVREGASSCDIMPYMGLYGRGNEKGSEATSMEEGQKRDFQQACHIHGVSANANETFFLAKTTNRTKKKVWYRIALCHGFSWGVFPCVHGCQVNITAFIHTSIGYSSIWKRNVMNKGYAKHKTFRGKKYWECTNPSFLLLNFFDFANFRDTIRKPRSIESSSISYACLLIVTSLS